VGLWLKQDDGSLVEVSGGGGGGGDYLPLTGGTVTGDLGVDGVLRLNGASESHISNNGSAGREILQIRATSEITTGAGINLYGSGDATNADRVLFYTSNEVTQALEADRSARFYGDLQVDGLIKAKGFGGQTAPSYGFTGDTEGLGLYGSPSSQWLRLTAGGLWRVQIGAEQVLIKPDLQVDGTITTGPGKAVFLGGNWENARINSAATAGRHYIVFGNGADGAQINLYGMSDATAPGNILFYAGQADGGGSRTVGRWDGPTGKFIAYRDAEVRGDLKVNGQINGTLAFGIADDIDTAEVLERAETATMPAVDDEGVTTTDAEVESVTVNEVVTALLARVKEQATEIATLAATVEALTARIETLESNE